MTQQTPSLVDKCLIATPAITLSVTTPTNGPANPAFVGCNQCPSLQSRIRLTCTGFQSVPQRFVLAVIPGNADVKLLKSIAVADAIALTDAADAIIAFILD